MSTQPKRSKPNSLTPLLISGTLIILPSLPTFASADATTEKQNSRYTADVFMTSNPQTLYDILQNIPGGNILLVQIENTAQNRGFGSAGDQILINGKRLSGKSNSIRKEMEKIQATTVEYVELIRGTQSGLDVQSEGLIINVVLKKQIKASTLISLSGVKTAGLKAKPFGSVFYSDGRENLKYRIGIEHYVNPTQFTITDAFSTPENQLTDRFTRVRKNWFKRNRLTGKLEYQISDKTALEINAQYAKRYTDSVTDFSIENFITDTNTTKDNILDYNWKNWEISGDLIYKMNKAHTLKLLFISNREDGDEKFWQSTLVDGQDPLPDFHVPRLYTTKENILRTNWIYKINPRHSLDSGTEVAINSRQENLQFIRQSGSPYHTTELNDIKETRFEGFLHYNFAVTPSLNIQSSLVFEKSKLDVDTNFSILTDTVQTADSQSSRTFSYFKPRLNIRYDFDDIYQLRLNYARTASQLNLNDFVPVFDSFESRLEETNPNLRPEVRNEFSVSLERQLKAMKGSVNTTLYYHQIKDLLTEIPLTRLSGIGNISSGKEYGLRVNSYFNLSPIGLQNTMISGDFLWRGSDMLHPFFGENTSIDRLSKTEWNITLNQKEILPKTSLNLTLAKKSPYNFARHDQHGRQYRDMTAGAFIDYQINPAFRLRLRGIYLRNRQYGYQRTRYAGLQTQSPITRYEERTYRFERRFSLTLTGRF